jgi:hypothetical protein
MATLHEEIDDVLERLGDQANDIWTRDEVEQAYRDGYDVFCRKTKCIFDHWVIENLPVTGNWQTDLERYLMEQKAGRSLTDQPFGYTAEHEKDIGTGGRYASGRPVSPTPGTAVSDKEFYDADNVGALSSDLPTNVPGGDLPRSVVAVTAVYYDERRLKPTTTREIKLIDPNYENRQGDPELYTWDKDGLFYLRVIPKATGGASYATVNGQRGRVKYTDESGVTAVAAGPGGKSTNGFGVLRQEEDTFPMGGCWGSPTRIHPSAENIEVELYRLGRDPGSHCIELPNAYRKYIVFYAMAKALERPGHGQDLKMSQHYMQRFHMGVDRMQRKRDTMEQEYEGAFGGGDEVGPDFGLGDPQPPLWDWDMTAPS